jgi:hypothetical protein
MIHVKFPISYIDFILSFDAKNITLEEAATGYDGKIFCLRHDVDLLKWFGFAHKMAKLEYENGIRSTYCIINSDKNFYKQKTIDDCKRLVDLGHNINLHLNVIDTYLKKKTSIKSMIQKSLDFLRSNGLIIEGVSAHGTPKNYIYGFNYEMWKECDPNKYQVLGKLNLDKISLLDFDLTYETTFIGHDAYLSDKRENFFSYFTKDFKIILFDTYASESEHNKGLDIIEMFNKLEKGFIQVNIHPHPQRWKV